MAPTALNKLSPYGAPACLTPWTDKRACAAYLGGCVYSGKCAGQVASLEAGFCLNPNEDIQQWQRTADGRATSSQCPPCSVHYKL